MGVLPLLRSPRPPEWGAAHRSAPQRLLFTFTKLIAPIILFMLVAMPTASAQGAPQCQGHKHLEVNPKHLYVQHKEKTVTLMTSRRIPHQLLTQVLAVLLHCHLGYVNVRMTYSDEFLPDQIIEAMGFDEAEAGAEADDLPRNVFPRAIVNLEVWTPQNYTHNLYTHLPIFRFRHLDVVGRLGWFFPAFVVQKYGIIDHWRVFAEAHSNAANVFGRTDEELRSMDSQLKDPATDNYYCTDSRCSDGVFSPPVCRNSSCSVLFASYFNQSSFLIEHVSNMTLYVKVAWLGPNLNRYFLDHNIDLSATGRSRSRGEEESGRSVLIYHYTPDGLLQPFDLTAVSFPSCADNMQYASIRKSLFCVYEMHRFNKIIWSTLAKADLNLYKVLERVSVDMDDYNGLMHEYNLDEKRDMNEIAWAWLGKNKNVWRNWVNGQTKQKLYLVGFFPMSTPSHETQKFVAPGNLPAFDMALEAINSNKSILPDHKIEKIVTNTGCEPDVVMVEFIKIIQSTTESGSLSKIIGIVGPACSDTIEPIAGVSKYFRIPIISYGAEGAVLSDRAQYPYVFRTIPENKIFRYER